MTKQTTQIFFVNIISPNFMQFTMNPFHFMLYQASSKQHINIFFMPYAFKNIFIDTFCFFNFFNILP